MSTAEHFYRDREPFHHFVEEVFQARFYRPLPADWLLVITDISGSTKAVESGKSAEVNYVGAACIVAVHNALPQLELPAVFGGDGATLAIPPSMRAATVMALRATQRWARASFQLELRVGVVPVADLTARGAAIEVAKMEFSAMLKEVKTLTGPLWRRWLQVFGQHVAQALVFWFSLHPHGFDPLQYKHEITLNADFHKVSGMLRLILDCTAQQADEIDTELARMRRAGLLHFGTHRSTQAIMTCVTPNVDNHEHVHFIDGGDGGLYSAARQLKAQMAASAD